MDLQLLGLVFKFYDVVVLGTIYSGFAFVSRVVGIEVAVNLYDFYNFGILRVGEQGERSPCFPNWV